MQGGRYKVGSHLGARGKRVFEFGRWNGEGGIKERKNCNFYKLSSFLIFFYDGNYLDGSGADRKREMRISTPTSLNLKYRIPMINRLRCPT